MANGKVKLEYPHGAMLVYPHSDGHAVQLTYAGSFGRKKLRKMLRDTTPLRKKAEIEFAIDNFITKLVPVDFKAQTKAIYEEGVNA
jgi:hypothetical protein